MADIEVGFVNVYEKFGIRALSDYQREAITQFVNNTGIAHWFSREIWAGSRYRFLKAFRAYILCPCGQLFPFSIKIKRVTMLSTVQESN